VASFRSCGHPCKFVRVGLLRPSVSAHSGGLFGQGCARANEPISKMLSCDPRLALCTFMQLVCPKLPCVSRERWVGNRVVFSGLPEG